MAAEHGAGGWVPEHSWKHREDALAGGLVGGLRAPRPTYGQMVKEIPLKKGVFQCR